MRRARVVLVLVAVVLVAVLAGYIGYARRKLQQYVHDLPRHLGVDITQETDGYTYSQSLKRKTIFTVHAAKELQHRNGLITLKDVGIVLYGAAGNRADRIHGQEFEYDPKNGILRAVGEALIDLGPPGDAAPDEAHMIHVKTSGLIFRKDDGTAETAEGVEFSANGIVGQAVGAAYSTKTNLLILQSAVKMSGLRGALGKERPLVLTAAHAEVNRTQNTVLLTEPKYVSTGQAGAQSASAAQATVHTGTDDKPKDVEARGHVRLTGAGRGVIDAERMDVAQNDDGQPREGHLYGEVRFANDAPGRSEQGRAQDVRLAFDPVGRARHALLTGGVELDQAAGSSTRQLNAERVDLSLGGGGKEKAVLRGAVASGSEGARLRLVDSADNGTSATSVRAETLTGRFNGVGLTGLDGTGKTWLERVDSNPKGQALAKETSTGDTLSVDLKAAAAGKGKGRMELARAVQRGSVTIIREAAARKAGAPPELEHARAETGDYQADKDQLTLTGNAEVSDAASSVFADKVLLDRASGDAYADGAVRVSYQQGKPGAEPVHALAAQALAHKATGVTEFTSAAGRMVRLWQGGSQVEAPVVDLDRNRKTMVAHGAAAQDDQVRTILAAQPAKPGAKQQPPVRVVSRQMTYSDASRQVNFAGHVQVTEADGTLHAQDAVVYLAPAAQAETPGLFGGKVDRVVATGSVELAEPGRKASGEKIVYTTADETYLLTGTKAIPPRLNDEQRGTITGAQLRFKRGDESVEVVGGEGGGRVRSEPRARQ